MNLVPTKLHNQLEELVKSKIVVSYRPVTQTQILDYNIPNRSLIFNGPNGIEFVVDYTKSVAKTERPMVIEELFTTGKLPSKEQNDLKYLFELEKELEELRKLKQSVDTIKDMFKKEDK